ncbi:excisionase family DNA-binding protein [Nocardioides sp.]|uniref:excisionase family DNA-binding protein n=1 Tax=Nocardioides sp. TaxID=35761 RepID=UPI002C032AF0|nr:excisionase family DNA-binding protein [Nocardioides sp.]HXH78372.1 excisionase family DNA-binding protein [Nocardioides sp.]
MTTKRTPSIPEQRTTSAFLTIEEAAEFMSMSCITIRRHIGQGSIPAYKCGKRLIRIRREDLEAAMKRIPTTGQ